MWHGLTSLEKDPFSEVATMTRTLTDYIRFKVVLSYIYASYSNKNYCTSLRQKSRYRQKMGRMGEFILILILATIQLTDLSLRKLNSLNHF